MPGFGDAFDAASVRADETGTPRRSRREYADAVEVATVVATLRTPAEPPAARPVDATLELVLDDEWRVEPDEAPGAPDDAGDREPVVTVEKSLAEWVTRITNAASGAGREPASGDPVEGRAEMGSTPTIIEQSTATGEPAIAPSRSADALWDATVRAVSLSRAALPSRTDRAPDPPAEAAAKTTPESRGLPLDVGLDAETLLREFAPAMRTIEIAGFPFPLGGEPADADADTAGPTAAEPAATALSDTEWRLQWPTKTALGRTLETESARLASAPKPGTAAGHATDRRSGDAESAPSVSSWSEVVEPASELLRPKAVEGPTVPVPARAADAASPPRAELPAVEALRPVAPVVEPRPVPRPGMVTVDLGDQFSDVGRLRLSIQGPSLRATILPSDPGLASRLDAGVSDLQQALRERGFADPRVSVRPAPLEPAGTQVQIGREPVAPGAARSEAPAGPPAERGPTGRQTDPEHQRPGQRHGGQRRERPGGERQQRERWA